VQHPDRLVHENQSRFAEVGADCALVLIKLSSATER